MEVYVIGEKKDFTEEQIKRLEKVGSLNFIEEKHDMYNSEYVKSNEPKIIAVNPDFTDWKFPNDLIEKIPNLKGICLMSTSYSYIDLEFCNKRNIIVTNVPKYSTDSVAEYACFLMMSIARKVPLQIKNNLKEDFSSTYLQMQVKGKKAAIIGLGSIGTRIAEILSGIGMDVIYWSRKSRNDKFEYKELSEIFKTADFIFPTFSVNEETKKIITDQLINLMKNTSSIVSIIGTDIFNTDLIFDKIKSNELYGFAFEESNSNLNNYEGNVMVTSPYAWYTKEALENCIEIWVQSIEGVNIGEIVNQVQQ